MELPLEEKRNRVILSLYQLRYAKGESVDIEELEKLADVGNDFYPIIRELGRNRRGWLEHRNLYVRILPAGIEKAEELLKMQMATKQRRVLRKIYDLGGPSHMHMVNISALEQALEMRFDELNSILIDFEQRELIGAIEHAVWLLPAGLNEVERVNNPEQSRPYIIIHNPTNSPMSFGPNSSQTVNYNGQSTEEIVPQLIRMIEAIHALDFNTKEDVVSELTKVQALTLGDMNADKWQLIQSRLLTTKTVLEIAKISAQTLPFWPAIWNYFFK